MRRVIAAGARGRRKLTVTEDDCAQALRRFRRAGGAVQRLPDEYIVPRRAVVATSVRYAEDLSLVVSSRHKVADVPTFDLAEMVG